MSIQDLASNPFLSSSSPMIGFVDPGLSPSRELSLSMYRFLIEGIREADQAQGARFVERFLEGPQRVWNGIDATMRSLPDMWSVVKCADRFLPYLKWIVGWTSKLDYITDDMDAATLRRLIATSIPFWKIRGTEDALVEILRLTTGKRVRIWDWFDLRYISDETALGEENQGYDSWALNLPGPSDYEERQMNVRIVDDGALNRRLVRNLVKLTRPAGERVTISYLGFLDLFNTDDDSSQWTERVGAVPPLVENGRMFVGQTNSIYANPSGSTSTSWRNYIFSMRFRGPSVIVEGYRTGNGDSYLVFVDNVNQQVRIHAIIAGSISLLAAVFPFALYGMTLYTDVFYMLRVALVDEGGSTRITVWLDGNLMCTALNGAHTQGTIGFAALFVPVTVEVDEVELFFVPLEEDFVDIVTAEGP